MPDIDPLANVRVVLCGTTHPGNIGASARAMKTMGLDRLHLAAPQCERDMQAERRAAHAADVVRSARVHANLGEALEGTVFAVACSARPRDIAVPETTAREGAARLLAHALKGPVAVVFGNEASGLTTEQVNQCRLLARIPANPQYSSLNLAAAVQVFAYELRIAACTDEKLVVREQATHEEIEGFYGHLETALLETGFFDPQHPRKLMPRFRRLFARAGLDRDEVNILRGLLSALSRSSRKVD